MIILLVFFCGGVQVGQAVTLKYKTANFDVKTRISQLTCHTADAELIARAAKKILTSEAEAHSNAAPALVLRLLGVRMSQLMNSADQTATTKGKKQPTLSQLLEELPAKRRKLEPQPPAEMSGQDKADRRVEYYTCPVCNSWKTLDEEIDLNRHIDECLNVKLLPGAVQNSKPDCDSHRTKGQSKLDRFLVKQLPQ